VAEATDPLRIAAASDRDAGGIPRADRLERLLILAVGEVGGRPVVRPRAAWRELLQAHQPFGLVEWQRFQQDAVHHAEDGGRGANAERQREHDRCSEGGLLPEDARGVAHVLSEIAEQVSG
jgi:hypothetical protein